MNKRGLEPLKVNCLWL